MQDRYWSNRKTGKSMQCNLHLEPKMWLIMITFLWTLESIAQNVYDIVFLEFIILTSVSSIHLASAAAATTAFRLDLGLTRERGTFDVCGSRPLTRS